MSSDSSGKLALSRSFFNCIADCFPLECPKITQKCCKFFIQVFIFDKFHILHRFILFWFKLSSHKVFEIRVHETDFRGSVIPSDWIMSSFNLFFENFIFLYWCSRSFMFPNPVHFYHKCSIELRLKPTCSKAFWKNDPAAIPKSA